MGAGGKFRGRQSISIVNLYYMILVLLKVCWLAIDTYDLYFMVWLTVFQSCLYCLVNGLTIIVLPICLYFGWGGKCCVRSGVHFTNGVVGISVQCGEFHNV